MKIDIWSDVRCPFCYIGKRKFEMGLADFAHKDKVEIEWHSFQLDPGMQSQPGKSVYEYLAEKKGQSLEWSKQMHEHVTNTAKAVGLSYDFDKAKVASSYEAQRLIQLAKKYGKGDDAEERLFKAYFTEGVDISNKESLTQLGTDIGLTTVQLNELEDKNAFSVEVKRDEQAAQSMGINGVPFFVIDNKYGVSGAQSPETFLQVLQKVWEENKVTIINNDNADSCDVDGNCN